MVLNADFKGVSASTHSDADAVALAFRGSRFSPRSAGGRRKGTALSQVVVPQSAALESLIVKRYDSWNKNYQENRPRREPDQESKESKGSQPRNQYYLEISKIFGHEVQKCFKVHGYPPNLKFGKEGEFAGTFASLQSDSSVGRAEKRA